MNNGTKRIAYWDNVKAILIFLVVLGHFLLPVSGRGKSVTTVYYWIYAFHMPAFVFVSGFFSKSYVKKPYPARPLGFLVFYLIFRVLVWLISSILNQKLAGFRFFYTNGAPWYMFCMFLWYLAIPTFAIVRPAIAIPLTILASLLIGTDKEVSLFFGTSLFIAFFPFFLIGYHFKDEWIYRIKLWMRFFSAVLLFGCSLVLVFFRPALEPYLYVIYGSKHYISQGLTISQGVVTTLVWYFSAAGMTGALLCLVPRNRTFFTYIGTRTVSIYVLHRLLRDILQHFGLYNNLGKGIPLLLRCVIISVLVTFLTSGRYAFKLFNRIFYINWANG